MNLPQNYNCINSMQTSMQLAQQFECPICALNFDFAVKKPMMICISQHTVCKQCLEAIFKKGQEFAKCPFCRTSIHKDQVSEFRLLEQIKLTASTFRKEGSMIRKELMGAKKNEKQLEEELNAEKQKNEWLLSQLQLKNILFNAKNQEIAKLKSDNYKLGKLAGEQRIIIQQLSTKNKELSEKMKTDKQNIQKIQPKGQVRRNIFSVNRKDNFSQNLKKIEAIIPKDFENERMFKKSMELKEIDLRAKVNLIQLDLSQNQLSSLNLTSNINLKKLNVSWNQLFTIDLSKNCNLKQLYLSYNQLQSINLSKNVHLTHLDLTKNLLLSLNISSNKNLQVLQVSLNQLLSIDLSNNPNLLEIGLAQNKLQKLDVKNCPQLKRLNASLNRLSQVVIDKNSNLLELNLQKNSLISLDTSQNISLTHLNLASNQLSSIDLMRNINLVDLQLQNNRFSTVINFMNNLKLCKVDLSNNQLKAIDLSINRNVLKLNLSENKLFSIKFYFRPQILQSLNDKYLPSLNMEHQNSSKTQIEISLKCENQKECVEMIERLIPQYRKQGKYNKYNDQYVFSMLQRV